ncbi:pirin family protein [Bacteroides finegoldii DSM 17565]|nr:pirin family protein [Bacteroides finegoldii DSM 17565]
MFTKHINNKKKELFMKKVIHRADTRGHSQYDWLDSYHTFSFDEYFDSNRINFGALRVLNDDKVAPGEGFQTHPHKNMEIVSIPLKGHLQHGDSKKNSRIITVGEIQTMSAGTGIFHSEVNASPVEPVEFLQIWIMPRERNTRPVYQDFNISELECPNELAVIVSPDGSTPASLLQDTWFSIGKVEADKKLGYHMHQSHAGVYIFLIEGEIAVEGEVLKRRDGMGIYETNSFELETLKDSHILLIEVPM